MSVMQIPERFSAFRVHEDHSGHRAGLETVQLGQLNAGEVIVKAEYSSVNYKDALAGTGRGKILRSFPLVGGIDAAGHVVASQDARFKEGDAVLITGCGLSETRDGGYSQYQRHEAQWLVPLPSGLTLREAMVIGTAGFTAALSLWRMLANGQKPEMGAIVVTGATGGVGVLALDIFTQAGFEMHAITGKLDQFAYLQRLGAKQCVLRSGLSFGTRPLESATWAGAVDNVGGNLLSDLTRVIKPWGAIASCGLAGGHTLETTVMPFIIRGISLLGINSANTPNPLRTELWQRLASVWKPQHLDAICTQEVALTELPIVFDRLMQGGARGRTLVRIDHADSSAS
jgi:acrylyl-CoA reductase (NADPH)